MRHRSSVRRELKRAEEALAREAEKAARDAEREREWRRIQQRMTISLNDRARDELEKLVTLRGKNASTVICEAISVWEKLCTVAEGDPTPQFTVVHRGRSWVLRMGTGLIRRVDTDTEFSGA